MPGANNGKRLIIGLTAQCNCMCRFCIIGRGRSSLKDPDCSYIKGVMKKYRSGYPNVIFTGGEPTLFPGLIELVKYASRLGYKVGVNSNGRMYAYRDFCLKMVDAGVDSFIVSLHGHNAKLNDMLTQAEGSFDEVTAGISNFITLGKSVSVITLINKLNYMYLSKIVTMLLGIGIKSIHFIFYRKPSGLLNDSSFPDFKKTEIKKVLLEVKKAIRVALEAKATIAVKFIPFCYMKGYEKCVVPYRKKGDRVLYLKSKDKSEVDLNLGEYVKFRKNIDCKTCKYDSTCEGIETSLPFAPRPVKIRNA